MCFVCFSICSGTPTFSFHLLVKDKPRKKRSGDAALSLEKKESAEMKQSEDFSVRGPLKIRYSSSGSKGVQTNKQKKLISLGLTQLGYFIASPSA